MANSVYIPEVNWLMMILTIVCIAIFKTTTVLGNAYGEPSREQPSIIPLEDLYHPHSLTPWVTGISVFHIRWVN